MSRVLVVDDVRLLADLRGTALARSGVTLFAARDRAALVESAREAKPDVIVLSDGEGCPEPCSTARAVRRPPVSSDATILFVGSLVHASHGRAAGIDLFVPRHAGPVLLEDALAKATRLAARRTRRWPVDLEWSAELEGGTARGRCVDLSLGGCFVVGDGASTVEPGAAGLARLDLGDRVIAVDARATRRGHGRDGTAGTAFAFRPRDAGDVGALSRAVRVAAERRRTGAEDVP